MLAIIKRGGVKFRTRLWLRPTATMVANNRLERLNMHPGSPSTSTDIFFYQYLNIYEKSVM